MEKEALLSAIKSNLGSTKLQFSDRTLSDYCSGVISTLGDDVELTDEFASAHAGILKSFNGQYHSDFSAELKKMRESSPLPTAEEKPLEGSKEGEKEPSWFAAYRESQEKRIANLEKARKDSESAARLAAKRKSLEDGLRGRLSESGVRVNEYVLKNSLRDVDLDSDNALTEAERLYNDGIKELSSSDYGYPLAGNVGGNEGVSSAEQWFKKRHKDSGESGK